MDSQLYRKSHTLTLALAGIFIIGLSVVAASLDKTHQPQAPNNAASFQKTAQTVLGCSDYDTLLVSNFNQQLYVGYATLSQMTTRIPGQNQDLLNYEYNTLASQAYSLYTGALDSQNCPPSAAAPTQASPASPPNFSFDPNNVDTSIPLQCNYPLTLGYVNTFAQQYGRIMQNEQSSLVNFVSNFQPAPTSLTVTLQQGANAIQQSDLTGLSKNLLQLFDADMSTAGC